MIDVSPSDGHTATFYDLTFPGTEVAGFLAGALVHGAAAVAIATQAHREAIVEPLDRSLPVAQAAASHGHLVAEVQQQARLVRMRSEHIARLQQGTAALAEAVTGADIAQVVFGEVAAAVAADHVALGLAADDD